MCGFILCHLILSKSFIAHALCLTRPNFKFRLGHLTFAHAGKVFLYARWWTFQISLLSTFSLKLFAAPISRQVFPP